MYPHRSLRDPTNIDALIRRLGRVAPESGRRWGTLTPHEMLCHLSDSFLVALGERAARSGETWFRRTIMKWVALHTTFPWPRGVPTRPEVDPKRRGSQPKDFERDREALIECLRRFARPDATYERHPAFGAMTRQEWLLWGFGHVDHHLRQFGL